MITYCNHSENIICGSCLMKNHGLLDDSGKFNNAFKLADLFCGIGSGGKKKK